MNQVSWNRQLGLALALFTLGTLAYWLEFKHKPNQEEATEQSKKVFSLKETPVKSISLAEGQKIVTLTCSDFSAKLCKPGDNSKWEISEPSHLKADDANANALVSTLNNLNSIDVIDLKDETPEKKTSLLKEYGLDPASLKTAKTVKVVTDKGESVLYLGQTHPMGESIFSVLEKGTPGQTASGKIDESRVLLIGNFFKANLDRDLTYWRNKKLFSLGSHDIASFNLNGKEGEIAAERKNGAWILHTRGEELPGDAENIDSLLNTVTFLSAKSFAADNKPGLKPGTPSDAQAKAALSGFNKVLTLTLQKASGEAAENEKKATPPIVLTLFQKKPFTPTGKLLATLSNLDPIFELDPSTKDRLDKTIKDLRLNKLLTSMEKFSAKRLVVSGHSLGDKPIALTSENGKWHFDSDKSEAANDKVQATLDKLSGNRIKDFLSGKAIPTGEKDGIKLTLGDDKNPDQHEYLFWKKDGKLYARDLKSTRKEVLLIDNNVESALPWTPEYYKPTVAPKAEAKPNVTKK